MYAFVNWGQLGTYLVHPDHMNVRFPSNVEDDDIRPGYNCDRPLSGPVTVMTFLIARLLIANIIQKLTDAVNKAELGGMELDYSTVMIFDKKINDTYNALPAYLHYETDPAYLKKLFEERPYLDRQRKLLLFGLHNSLALLHRRYLARSYQYQQYIYSRMICLRSTRIVLEMQEAVRGSLLGSAWLVVYHVFIATTTLTMDYVYNRRDPRQAAERKAEILKCYRILEQCGQQDPEVKQGMESLKRTMQEWKSRADTRPARLRAHPSIPGEPAAAEGAENWSASRSSELVLQSQPQQMISQAPPPELTGAGGLPWWSRDAAAPSLGLQNMMTQHAASESLGRSVEDDPDWPDSRSLPFDVPHMTRVSGEPHGLSMAPPELSTTGAQSMQPGSPDLWLPCLDPDGTGTADFPWEDMFRDFGVQQSRAGF
ncbi:hypothetical protein CLCR_05921 [Cladophialophora carrionii]|uniref:Uncharacterized protein n=1 Tax=Cladophialophora carrionii TaxID=86049 RepID=A0A1C1C8A0_9EURO|nr:hypothetical protein CLCR_05921 [Cladophialophora carrionii]